MYRDDYLYKRLPPLVNHVLVSLYIGICAYAFVYFWFNFERIAIYAQGSYTQHDFIVGLLMFLVVMELTRLAHPILFWVNVFLVVYTMWGYLSPIDFFWHPGTTLLSRHHVEHDRAVDRHLRPVRPACAHADRGVPAAGRRRQRLQCAELHDQRGAPGRAIAAPYPANRGGGIEHDRTDQRLGLRQRRRGRHRHHSADDALRRARHLRRCGRDRGLDGRPDRSADDGGGRLPDGGVHGRALLGRGDPRLCARLRLLHFDRRRRVSAVRPAPAGRQDRQAAGAALRQGHDRDLFRFGALPRLSHGCRRQGRAARCALHRDLHGGAADRAHSSISSMC